MSSANCFLILGPTASGKSRLAMHLAKATGGAIVNGDAMQVYRHMNIGTAKPTTSDFAAAEHYLYDIVDPGVQLSAGEYAVLARAKIAELLDLGRAVFVVGGSGFYLEALFEGLSPIPPVTAEVRKRLAAAWSDTSTAALHDRLETVDAAAFQRISPQDRYRIERALEIFHATGYNQSYWHSQPKVPFLYGSKRCVPTKLGVSVERTSLYRRIDQRVVEMFKEGLVEEARTLAGAVTSGIGYGEAFAYCNGDLSLDDAIAATAQATRRYAKRQITWLRRQAGVEWLPAVSAADKAAIAEAVVASKVA